MVYMTKNPNETRKTAENLIQKIIKQPSKKATVIGLEGELGAGKTVFAQGLAKALRIKYKIKSPTFSLMKRYAIEDISSLNSLYHLDCYRLRNHQDLKPLGIKEILENPSNLVLIEWSDRVKKILPRNYIRIHIDHTGPKTRKITIAS